MSSDLRRGALAATALVLSIASLSACAAGNDAQSLEIKPDNAATSVGDIAVQNATIITQPDRNATGPAVVNARIFNNGTSDQTLKSITVAGHPVKLSPAKGSGPVVVPKGYAITIGGKGNASAVLEKGREAAEDGSAQTVAFDFSTTGEVKLDAFVVPATSYFDKWGPSEMPSAPAQSGPPAQKPSDKASDVPAGEHDAGQPADKPSGQAADKPADKPADRQGVATGEPNPNGQTAGH
ncbi:DUF461 domain-containing protein [Streptomyces palmae]|uniref:DUF461 domain-containing protein n=1 Tax=Streptomyces palmae TaxID=1701085 RepID=A0A4Z0HE01_9ACTN|nr:DUF461 domain-containing protein [Streptomyces palmae]TGB19361.1 DUF461 domain-containing protein [Streptomyces palmae]